ncbi:unnamed protein product [Absidia cylindrospora]
MSMLIDSLMKKFYIPPLLFAVRTDDKGKQIRVCIDGKQRLTSILRFTKNEIPYLDESTGVVEEVYFGPATDNTVRDKIDQRYLSEEARDNFNDTELVMIEFSDLDEDQELEIFARVQMGVSITSAEKLVATNSAVSKFCRDLINDHQHLDSTIRQLRGASFQWVAQLIFILHQDSNSYVATYSRLMEFLKDRTIFFSDVFMRKVRRTIKWLDALFQNESGKAAITYKGGEASKKRDLLRNIEFLIFGVYVSKLNNSTRVPDLASDLSSLRQYLVAEYGRKLHTGNPCWTAGLTWVERTMANRRRTQPAGRISSSSNGNRQGVMADSDTTSSDENDMDSDDNGGIGSSNGRHNLKKQARNTPISASKRRRSSRHEYVEAKSEEPQVETTTATATTSTTRGHVNEHGRPLARRGGKKSGPSRK